VFFISLNKGMRYLERCRQQPAKDKLAASLFFFACFTGLLLSSTYLTNKQAAFLRLHKKNPAVKSTGFYVFV
jgi:hypothetical protein